MAAPILNLDSLIDRPTVVIGEQEYWLVTLDIMPPLDVHRLQRGMRRVAELALKDDLTAEEEAELGTLPDRLCRMVLEAPDEVHQKRTDRERMLIAETAASTFRSGLRTPALAPLTPPASPSTGANGSPG